MDKNILKKQDNTYKLIITPELEEKIRFLCARFPNNEYSKTNTIQRKDITGSTKRIYAVRIYQSYC